MGLNDTFSSNVGLVHGEEFVVLINFIPGEISIIFSPRSCVPEFNAILSNKS